MASDPENAAQNDSTFQSVAPPRLHAADLLNVITVAFMTPDHAWRFTYLNDQAERMLARAREDLLGRDIWEEFPEAVGTAFEREYRR